MNIIQPVIKFVKDVIYVASVIVVATVIANLLLQPLVIVVI
ncbi:hypothetical protein [Gloeothece verrucosa]|uniref:Uncharacterized protein n=1 Tax=Gloeothece verrucosa (strain PCC 7822) TaxID=497965 RepID=E0UKP9_GLOV7|nr:hypothetical protein [Gloeothece verrucosa]ADN17529.1 hypothetical protein Cyan7822_5664 [Gloeothece verrucosa PCC 7822]